MSKSNGSHADLQAELFLDDAPDAGTREMAQAAAKGDGGGGAPQGRVRRKGSRTRGDAPAAESQPEKAAAQPAAKEAVPTKAADKPAAKPSAKAKPQPAPKPTDAKAAAAKDTAPKDPTPPEPPPAADDAREAAPEPAPAPQAAAAEAAPAAGSAPEPPVASAEAPAETDAGPRVLRLVHTAEGCWKELEDGQRVELSEADWHAELARHFRRNTAVAAHDTAADAAAGESPAEAPPEAGG